MASKNLPTDLVGGESGHPALHNDIHDVVNEFDYDAIAAGSDGQVIKRSGGLWTAGTDNDSAAGGGAEIGRRFVDPQQADNTGDGFTPATAKRDIQAAVNSLSTQGGEVVMASHADHMLGSTVADNGKPISFTGLGKFATTIVATSQGMGPCFHLTGRGSGVRDLQINVANAAHTGIGGVLLHEKNNWIKGLSFWRIGRDVTTAFEAADPDAPYGIKALSPSTTEATYPSLDGTLLADWLIINDCYFFFTYRAMALLAGQNAAITQMIGEGAERGAFLYVERGPALVESSLMMSDSFMVGDPGDHPAGTKDSGYMVYIDRNASGDPDIGWVRFVNVETESFGNGPAHYWCNLTRCSWIGCSAGGTGGQDRVIDFGTQGNSGTNFVYPFMLGGNTPNTFQNASNVRFVTTQAGP